MGNCIAGNYEGVYLALDMAVRRRSRKCQRRDIMIYIMEAVLLLEAQNVLRQCLYTIQ